MKDQKVIYIAGPIADVPEYWVAFEKAEDILSAWGYIPLNPARLPQGMPDKAYMRIDLAMIDSADAVVFLPGYESSKGAMLEFKYCLYTDKPVAFMTNLFDKNDAEKMANLKIYLEKVVEK